MSALGQNSDRANINPFAQKKFLFIFLNEWVNVCAEHVHDTAERDRELSLCLWLAQQNLKKTKNVESTL